MYCIHLHIFSKIFVAVRSRQYLGKIKRVEGEPLSLFEGHDLDVEGPGRVVSICDCIEKVSDRIIWVGGRQAVGLLHWKVFNPLIGLKVHQK